MPRVEATTVVSVTPDVAFAMSQTQAPLRYRWDTFVRHQELLDGAERPDVGVQTFTKSRHGLRMVSEYQSYKPPRQVGMKMVKGPWFFSNFGGGWSFADVGGGTKVTWRYTFTIAPKWLRPIGDRIGTWLLGRDIERRLAGYAAAFDDPELLAAVEADLLG